MSDSSTENDRKIRRVNVNMPVRVYGYESADKVWDEITNTIDLSSIGSKFRLTHTVEVGEILKLTLPMPEKLRSYDFLELQYQVWAIVTSAQESSNSDGKHSYGVAFLGKSPPSSFLKNPMTRFTIHPNDERTGFKLVPRSGDEVEDSTSDKTKSIIDRKHTRLQIPVSITLHVAEEAGDERYESTVMENVSISGASIFSSMNIDVGSSVIVNSDQYNLTLSAIVRGKRIGQDGIPRLHVEFTNGIFPLEGMD